MFGLNPLRTKVLITVDEVVFHAPVESDVDVRSILQSIIIAERRFIKPMLGSTVYEALINKKNLVITAGNKVAQQVIVNTGRANREQIVLVEGDIVNSDTYLNSTELALWNNYLHKIVAECVYFIALPVNRTRFTGAGLMKNNPESIASTEKSASISLAELKHLMDKSLQDRIAPLMEDMHAYMCSVSYAGYDKSCTDCYPDGSAAPGRKSNIIFGMYDDDDDCRCKITGL